MAEIKIEKKSPVWPWILLVVFLAIIIYVFAFDNERNDTEYRQENTTEQKFEDDIEITQKSLHNSAVATYVNFIKEDSYPMGLDHEFTNEGLLKLINATTALAVELDYDIQKDVEALKRYADKITNEPFKTTHANSIRKSADILTNIIINIQQNAFTNFASDAKVLKDAASKIAPDKLTLDQKDAVKNWFRKSATILEKMNTNPPQS